MKKGNKRCEPCVQRVVTNASELCEIDIEVIMRKDDDMYHGWVMLMIIIRRTKEGSENEELI